MGTHSKHWHSKTKTPPHRQSAHSTTPVVKMNFSLYAIMEPVVKALRQQHPSIWGYGDISSEEQFRINGQWSDSKKLVKYERREDEWWGRPSPSAIHRCAICRQCLICKKTTSCKRAIYQRLVDDCRWTFAGDDVMEMSVPASHFPFLHSTSIRMDTSDWLTDKLPLTNCRLQMDTTTTTLIKRSSSERLCVQHKAARNNWIEWIWIKFL